MPDPDPNFGLYTRRRTSIIVGETEPLRDAVDGFLDESHEREVTTTSYPVESGASLTDHAVRQPDKLTLTGWVSSLLPSSEANTSRPISERNVEAWRRIGELMRDREPVTVATLLGSYHNMLIVKASAPVNRRTGRALRFTIELQEILFAPLTVAAGGLRVNPTPNGPAVDREIAVDHGLLQVIESPRPVRPPPSVTGGFVGRSVRPPPGVQ